MLFFSRLSKKEKIGLILAGIFLLFSFLDRAIVSPIQKKIEKINKSIELSEKQLGWYLRNLNQKKAILEEYKKYIPPVLKSGSDEEEVAKVLGEIESLARSSSVYISNMKPQESKQEDFYKQYSVELEANGDQDAIVKFLLELNTSPQILRVEKLRFNAQKGGDANVKITALVTKVLIL